jgi:hypothetical protein
MFCDVIAVDSGLVRLLKELEAFAVLLVEGNIAPALHMIEDSKLHCRPPKARICMNGLRLAPELWMVKHWFNPWRGL